jgi:hypothetical protein
MSYDIWTEGLATIRKALTSSSAGTVLLQPVIDKIIPMLVNYRNPLRVNLPRKTGSGQAWIINARTSGSTPAAWVADTASSTEDTGTYAQRSFVYRTVLTRGQVTRKLQKTGKSYIDVLMEEIEGKTRDFKNFEDSTFMTGTSSATVPEGVQTLITDNQAITINSNNLGGPLTLAKMDEAWDQVSAEGQVEMMVMSLNVRRRLNALLQANQQFQDITPTTVKGGFTVTTYNLKPIFPSTNMPNVQAFNGSTVTANTGGTTSSIFFIDTDHLWVGELTPITFMPMAKTDSQFDRFDIFADEVLVLRNPQAISKLIGIWA